MSKYETKNGIIKTPVFHGEQFFFIKRKERVEVKEVLILDANLLGVYSKDIHMRERPFVEYQDNGLFGMLESLKLGRARTRTFRMLENELILRN